MTDQPRKRSRFDEKPAAEAPARKSRFDDRRSRSPQGSTPDPSRRSRSPTSRGHDSPSTKGAASPATPAAANAAAAAAAKINAQIMAMKATGNLPATTVAPVKRVATDEGAKSNIGANGLNMDIYEQDGDWIKDIEVNDLRNRYTLTKGATQKMIKEKTGADITTRGAYYPNKAMATAGNPPLYLHITSTSKEGLEAAVAEIEELMSQDLPNLIDERRMPRRRDPEEAAERRERNKWPEERIPIPLEPISGFNLRAQVVGHQGSYVKHIQSETGARVQIKGLNSGFLERDTNMEADEPMYLHVVGPDPDGVAKAKDLCLDLLKNVTMQYEQFKERGGFRGGDNRRGGGNYGGGDRNGSYGGYNGGGYQQHQQHQDEYQQSQYGGHDPQAAAQSFDPQVIAAWAEHYARNPQEDPYMAYGGYVAYMQAYMAHYQQGGQQEGAYGQQQQQQQQYPGSAGSAPPPPPPPAGDDPPPPPPPVDSGYNAVPPPPGL